MNLRPCSGKTTQRCSAHTRQLNKAQGKDLGLNRKLDSAEMRHRLKQSVLNSDKLDHVGSHKGAISRFISKQVRRLIDLERIKFFLASVSTLNRQLLRFNVSQHLISSLSLGVGPQLSCDAVGRISR